MSFLIYAANLHTGGGVQVATSFIAELIKLREAADEITVWVSSAIHKNLCELGFSPNVFVGYEVIDHYGLRARFSKERHEVKKFDNIFVVFGPHYLSLLSRVTHAQFVVMGFAQAWVLYSDNEAYALMPIWKRLLTRVKFGIQGRLFKNADQYVVELPHAKDALIRCGIGKTDKITVVRNCISSVYLEPEKWQSVYLPPRNAQLRLGYVGRNYLHKNTRIFPEVLSLLRSEHRLDVELMVTFTPSEWDACDEAFRASILNIGELTVAQCPFFYQSLDAVVFPSLLECFSATPLEAMVMEKPLFASDRFFVRDICGDFAYYFDPTDARDIAATLATYLKRPRDNERLERARNYAISFSSPRERAINYMRCLKDAV